MDQNLELLNYVYQNTKMGEELTSTVLKSVKDEHLKRDLITQMEGYSSLNDKARAQIYQDDEKPKEINPMVRTMSKSSTMWNTMMDKSPTHIAEMMIQGSTMGIIEATEKLNQYETAEKSVRSLARDVVHFEQNNIERLKSYLK